MSQTVLLDTHVLVWLVNGDAALSSTAQQFIAGAARVCVSAITPWEIGMLVAKGRLTLEKDVQEWISDVLALPGIHLVPLEPVITIASTRLPGDLHGDPADRLIAASARHLNATLITADEKLLAWAASGHVSALSAK